MGIWLKSWDQWIELLQAVRMSYTVYRTRFERFEYQNVCDLVCAEFYNNYLTINRRLKIV